MASMTPDEYDEKPACVSPKRTEEPPIDWPTASDEPAIARVKLRRIITILEDSTARRTALKVALSNNLPEKALDSVRSLDFETRKDAVGVFDALLRLADRVGAGQVLSERLKAQPERLIQLLELEAPDFATYSTLQSCARSSDVAKTLLELDALPKLLKAVTRSSAELTLDAFGLLRELFCGPAANACASYLAHSSVEFFDAYHRLLKVEDYLTQRQSLSLLSDMLVLPTYMQVMTEYVSKPRHLQVIMDCFRSPFLSIQLESFHILKLFAVNPHRPRRVRQILHRNSARLVRRLRQLAFSRSSDKDLQAEVDFVVQETVAITAPERLPPDV